MSVAVFRNPLLRGLFSLCLPLGVLLLPLNAQRSATPAFDLPEEGRYANSPIPDIVADSLQKPRFRLSDVWRERPVLLTLVFTRCSGICSPFLMSLKSAVDALGGLGSEYRVVVLSFDPLDTPADMASLARHIGVSANRDWIFGTSTAAEIERVVRSTGFWFQWDTERGQFDHPHAGGSERRPDRAPSGWWSCVASSVEGSG